MPLHLALVLAFAAGPSGPDVEEILSAYPAYERMTPEPVRVDAGFLESCVRISPDELDAPHGGGLVSIFMNTMAAAAFRGPDETRYPHGSVILKRKEPMAGRSPAYGGMIKREPGYDPANGDWEYFTGSPKQGFLSGRLAECGDCHARAQATDHVFGDWAGMPPAQ